MQEQTNRHPKVFIGIVALVLSVGIVGVGCMRENSQYDFEVVPLDKEIGIINLTSWNQRDLLVSWGKKAEGLRSNAVMKGSLNECVIEGLEPGQNYSIRIARTDLIGKLRYRPYKTEATTGIVKPSYIVLVGASVGKEWNLAALPKRTGINGFVLGHRGKYGYDKGDQVEKLAGVSSSKPDIAIIKECAAYFPKELERIIEKLPLWVDTLASSGITPVAATCCPVTEENDKANPGRQKAIDEFNRFVRAYAMQNNMSVVDLAKTLQVSETDTHLRGDYAQPDGLHLTPRAYLALDSMLVSLLNSGLRSGPATKETILSIQKAM